jgi:hypothetical protein
MDPFTILSIASTAFSVIGAVSQGNAAAKKSESEAQADEYNAAVQKQNADNALLVGNANEEAQRRKARLVMGAQRAGIAESGMSGSQTASDLLEQSAGNAEMDALNIRYGAQLQSTGYLNNSTLDTWQAKNDRESASAAKTAVYMNAGAKILSGAGSYIKGQALLKKSGSVGVSKDDL